MVVVAGKGGVGKTTVTAVLARAACETGRRVLVVELDGKPHLRTLVRDTPVLELTAPAALEDYLDTHGLKRVAKRLTSSGIIDVVSTAAPGIDDIVVLGKLKQLERSGDYDLIVVDGPASGFEGAVRPGHFSGVATVVCRRFQAVPADVAYFGAKDWQQTLVVKQMVRDLDLPIEVVVCPTVREPDGLALSSRNAYLSAADRRRAVALFESLALAAAMWPTDAPVAVIEDAIRGHLEAGGVAVDYAAIVAAETLEPASDTAAAIALVAGRLGSTRLIDNRLLPPRGRLGR
jgi:pantoate--beta-alanine ligase